MTVCLGCSVRVVENGLNGFQSNNVEQVTPLAGNE
jgi:hypothetical protein